jgi:hypothetical protein
MIFSVLDLPQSILYSEGSFIYYQRQNMFGQWSTDDRVERYVQNFYLENQKEKRPMDGFYVGLSSDVSTGMLSTDSALLRCDFVSLDKRFPAFRRNFSLSTRPEPRFTSLKRGFLIYRYEDNSNEHQTITILVCGFYLSDLEWASGVDHCKNNNC